MIRLASLFLLVLLAFPLSAHGEPFQVLQVNFEGTVSPASEEMLIESISYAQDSGVDLVLLRIDTPGGLGQSMRSMVKAILNSPIPVAVWVGPAGARATSAGVFLVAASDVAGMAPQTTIGAASPVSVTGDDIQKTMQAKVQNDFISLVRAVAARRDRNIEWYAESVQSAASITAAEALELNVIEYVSPSVHDFLVDIGEGGFTHDDESISFAGNQVVLETFKPGFSYSVLSWMLHPQIAYFLLLGGMIGLFFEITHPGAIFPGVLGGICLLMALYALSVLPTTAAGILLILFALVLLGLEVAITSYGLLTVAGAVALFMGGMLLFRDPYGYLHIPTWLVLVPSLIFVAFASLIIWLILRSRKTRFTSDSDSIVGQEGTVISWEKENGQIRVRGEIWAATAALSNFTPSRDTRVKIVARNGLRLQIEPLSPEPTNANG